MSLENALVFLTSEHDVFVFHGYRAEQILGLVNSMYALWMYERATTPEMKRLRYLLYTSCHHI